MGDEDATDRLSRYTAGDLKQAWGEPLKDSTVYYEKFSGDCRRYIWKLPDDMDYLCVFTSLNSHEILDVICCHVFKGYPVYEASDLTWGTVTPLPDEEEVAYGELIRINF
ncbi:MAG: hypothetical protein IJX72_06680, partial [Clostridia bacterium]|nr:hypothetical protein [Clostridia bacterium]